MGWIRWLVRAAPATVLAGAIVLGALVLPGRAPFGPSMAIAKGCPTTFGATPRGPALNAAAELRPNLNALGELAGRTLVISVSGSVRRSIELPPESFATPVRSNVVIYGRFDAARGSAVRAYDLQNGCDHTLSTSPDVVRSAVIDKGLRYLYLHSVSAAERSDRGLRRIEIGSGATRAIAPAIAADAAFGPTYATRLDWSLAGDELAVQSCGMQACRTRVVDAVAGALRATFDRAHGPLVGFNSARLFAFDTCDQLPCGLEVVDRGTGAITGLAVEAFSAHLEGTDSAPVISADTPAGPREIRP